MASGWENPSKSRHSGRQVRDLATVAKSRPPTVTTTGTGFVVCDVNGETPSASSSCSALP